MKKIKNVEDLKNHWKAALDVAVEVGKYYEAEQYFQRIYALDTVLKLINQPSNTRMHVDALISEKCLEGDSCDECGDIHKYLQENGH